MVHVTVPNAIQSGRNAIMTCDYELEDDDLYSVKWYKGKREFFRYTPKEIPSIKIFKLPGIRVDVSCWKIFLPHYLFRSHAFIPMQYFYWEMRACGDRDRKIKSRGYSLRKIRWFFVPRRIFVSSEILVALRNFVCLIIICGELKRKNHGKVVFEHKKLHKFFRKVVKSLKSLEENQQIID